jgi:curli biogenesis system outer membrane secretion channel CsgG
MKKIAFASLAALAMLLAFAIPSNAKEDKRLKVAVVDFQNQTGDASNDALIRGISDIMLSEMQKSGTYRLIERKRFENVLSELKLNMSGLVDAGNAKQVGSQLGVDALIFGNLTSVIPSSSKHTILIMWTESQKVGINLDARIVNVETGEVLKTAKVKEETGNRKWVAFGFARIGSIMDKNSMIQEGIEKGCAKLAKELSKKR